MIRVRNCGFGGVARTLGARRMVARADARAEPEAGPGAHKMSRTRASDAPFRRTSSEARSPGGASCPTVARKGEHVASRPVAFRKCYRRACDCELRLIFQQYQITIGN